MRFGPRPSAQAAGTVLAHTLRLESGTIRKGTVLSADDVRALAAAGIGEVTVAVLEEGDVREDEAAARLAEAALGPGLRLRGPFTGRCNLVSEWAGLVRVDEAGVRAANGVDEALTMATLRDWARVGEDELVATAKVIPLAVGSTALEAASAPLRRAQPVLEVLPFRPMRAGLVLTTLPGDAGTEGIRTRAREVTRRRLESLGSSLGRTVTVPHDVGSVADGLEELRAAGCDLLLVLGASAVVDRGDVVPRAVERAGGRVDRLGIPVDPGNLLLLASLHGDPVVGVPGCARSSRRSGFDTVLERLAARVYPDAEGLAGLGVGGLLREIPSRPQPRARDTKARDAGPGREPAGAGATGAAEWHSESDSEAAPESDSEAALEADSEANPKADSEADAKARAWRPRVAGLVLAAGTSRRMGPLNKVLQDVDGEPMVVVVARRLHEAGADPVVVVTGHEADEVEAALRSGPVRFVRNPRFGEGMGTSVAEGVAALGEGVDGVLICLADMPRVSPGTLRALIEAFERCPPGSASVLVPVHRGKRGNPVLWSAAFFDELEELSGDVGARTLLSEHAESVQPVDVEDPGVLLDVDTREALHRLEEDEGGPRP